MSLHHTDEPVCELCEGKLLEAHPFLRDWFHRLKAKYVNAHISWSYRGKEDQEKAFLAGTTKLHFPESAHNKSDSSGKPCSMALDLFQIDEDGNARWSPQWFLQVNQENLANKEPIFWGGQWARLGDNDHMEYRPVG